MMDWVLPLICSLILRSGVGLYPYSGERDVPTYGDFEAQRHWMEVTRGKPISEWYTYDVDYWGIDYPPLSAFHAFVTSFLIEAVDPAAVALFESRGYEEEGSRAAMRASVILWDMMVLIPAVFWFLSKRSISDSKKLRTFYYLACAPALLLVDHGHFQYNGVSLGLFVAALSSVISGRDVLGSIFFTLSMNFKHMTLYFLPALACYCLGRSRTRGLRYLAHLTLTILGTTFLIWAFFDVKVVLSRIFPVNRGLFEDKVANVWCSINPAIKLRNIFGKSTLLKLSGACTLVAILPSCFMVWKYPRPEVLVRALSICSLACYLLAYQVHEKQILIPQVAIGMLSEEEPLLAAIFSIFACTSMFPLLKREGQAISYLALLIIHAVFVYTTTIPKQKGRSPGFAIALSGTLIFIALLHLVEVLGPTVPTLPDLYTVMWTTASCAAFCTILLVLYLRLFQAVPRS
ncbi:hypothetical protein NDN08_000385 [Rhodosorus marinus]|uniref:Alpha-1,3-glucosyltransferase n=1 Tax=Rhodosorus marinus TaxID=101924 RepID=A0AAV8URU7_9RHOD|nr:hypothetical protein NDN08_000385 [Rhodosorus marinus]